MRRLFSYNSYAIISHIRPDGDTIGSGLGLYYALANMGKRVRLFCDGQIPSYLSVLEDSALYSSELPEEHFDCYIAVDCGDTTRLGRFYEGFKRAAASYNIDHHKTNNGYAKVNLVRNISSTCEVIYNLLKDNGIELDSKMAFALYSGLLTDTGGFSHSTTTPAVHTMAADLIGYGLDVAELSFKLIKEKSRQKFNMTMRVMNSLKLFLDGRLAVLTITKKDLLECGCADNEIDGFIDIGTSIAGTLAAISIMETKPNAYKVGFRSKTDAIDVSAAAARFGGGGHLRASGCIVHGFYEDVVDKLVRSISDFL